MPTIRTATSYTSASAVGFLVLVIVMAVAPAVVAAEEEEPRGTEQAARPATARAGSCTTCHAPLLARGGSVHAPAREDCSTCHLQEGDAHQFELAAPAMELCSICHEAVDQADAFVHGPAGVGACSACHDPHSSTERQLLRASGSALCETCHVEVTALLTGHRFVHAPVQQDCALCHDPHSAPSRYQLQAAGSQLCATCHQDLVSSARGATVVHAAISMERECLNCHDPHATDLRPQLRASTVTLCLGCHDKEITTPSGAVLVNMKAWLESNPDKHGPIREDDCSACHQPHGGEHFRLLSHDYPTEFYSPFDRRNYDLCFQCHQPDLVEVAQTTTLTGFRDGQRNLHYLHVNQPTKGRTCRACHDVHASVSPKHIRDSVPFGAWDLPLNYEKANDGGQCSPGCHATKQYRRGMAPAADATLEPARPPRPGW